MRGIFKKGKVGFFRLRFLLESHSKLTGKYWTDFVVPDSCDDKFRVEDIAGEQPGGGGGGRRT